MLKEITTKILNFHKDIFMILTYYVATKKEVLSYKS